MANGKRGRRSNLEIERDTLAEGKDADRRTIQQLRDQLVKHQNVIQMQARTIKSLINIINTVE